jgi:predicted permease
LLFAALVAALTCVLFGTLPAVRSAGADPISSIKSGERGVVGNRERFSVQRFMVVAQISVSMVLLVAALLFVRSYRNLITVDPGMRESTITIGFLGFPSANIKQENMAAYKRQIVGDIRAVPGIDDAAGTTHVPLSGGSWSHTVRIGSSDGSCKFTYASPSYFSTMGIPLVTGRAITAADTTDAPLVLVVNQAFVRKYFSGASPIGQDVHVLPEPQYPERTYRIVGTVADSKYFDLREDAPPIAYVPIDQFPVTAQRPGLAVVFASRDKAASVDAFHRMLQAKYPGMVMQFFDFQQGIRDNLVGDRLLALLSGFFGVLAALLVVVGLYGVLSYFLAQRRSEIGIRIALGATRARVVAQVVRDAVAMLLIGLVVGTALALAAGREAGTMLFGLKSWDPGSLVIAAALLIAVTLVTSLIPAIKAARLDPVSSLRTE